MLSTAELVEKLKYSVVHIVARGGDSGSGTGFIYNPKGLALTNYHVVAGATSIRVIVTNADGTEEELEAEVAGTAPDVDIVAIIIWGAYNFVPAQLGSVEDIDPGTEVVALGYPLSDVNSGSLIVTEGIVSGIWEDDGRTQIEHTATINPGSSGGSLLNKEGSVVGINTQVDRRSTSTVPYIEGVNIAVAIDEATSRIGDLEPGTLDSDTADTFSMKGIAFSAVGDHKRAIRELTTAIRLNDQNAYYYYDRGRSYHELDA